MTQKLRVYQVAKDFNVSSEALIGILEGLGVAARSHMSTLDDSVVDLIKQKFAEEKRAVQQEDVRKQEVKAALEREAREPKPQRPAAVPAAPAAPAAPPPRPVALETVSTPRPAPAPPKAEAPAPPPPAAPAAPPAPPAPPPPHRPPRPGGGRDGGMWTRRPSRTA